MPQITKLLKRNKTNEVVALWSNATTLSYVFICFFATGLFVFAPDVISLLYSEKYLSGVSVFRVYCIGLLLRCTYFGMILNSLAKTKFIFYSSLTSLGINSILNFVLYYIFGFVGPAIATIISITIINMIQLFFTSKQIKIKIDKILCWRDLGLITALNAVLGILFYSLKLVIPISNVVGSIAESIILGIVWLIIYVIALSKMIRKTWRTLDTGVA